VIHFSILERIMESWVSYEPVAEMWKPSVRYDALGARVGIVVGSAVAGSTIVKGPGAG